MRSLVAKVGNAQDNHHDRNDTRTISREIATTILNLFLRETQMFLILLHEIRQRVEDIFVESALEILGRRGDQCRVIHVELQD